MAGEELHIDHEVAAVGGAIVRLGRVGRRAEALLEASGGDVEHAARVLCVAVRALGGHPLDFVHAVEQARLPVRHRMRP